VGIFHSSTVAECGKTDPEVRNVMEIKSTDLVALFERSLQDLPEQKLEEIGIVVQVGDGICRVHGLTNAISGELIDFEGGNKGIIMQLDEDSVAIFLLQSNIPVAELEVAKRTGGPYTTPVGMRLLGRTINAIGVPIDGLGEIKADEYRTIEATIPVLLIVAPSMNH